jgi:hypothetical protein
MCAPEWTTYWASVNNSTKCIAFGRGDKVGSQVMLSTGLHIEKKFASTHDFFPVPAADYCHFPVSCIGLGTWDRGIPYRNIRISGGDHIAHGLEDAFSEFILPGLLGRYIYRYFSEILMKIHTFSSSSSWQLYDSNGAVIFDAEASSDIHVSFATSPGTGTGI